MSNCDKLLEGGLYSFTKMINTGSFNQDLKTYYLSEQFKTDMKSGKWGTTLTLPIGKVPVKIDMNFSEDQYSEFRSKIIEVTELSISSDNYQSFYSSIPNTNLYEAYVECEKINNDVSKKGFIEGATVETEDTVVFTIYYRPQAPGDPAPVVKNFNVQPEGSVTNGGLSTGQAVDYDTTITCKRHEDKDLVLTLDTDRGSIVVKSFSEGSLSSNKELPIGTIISSFLTFDQFNHVTKNNEKSPGGIWTSQKSKWSPCDGRMIPNSKFGKLTSQIEVPDLRGSFLRGLNIFDGAGENNGTVKRTSHPDPEYRTVGSFQKDAFEKHTHIVSQIKVGLYAKGHADDPGPVGGYPGDWNHPVLETGGSETRPKNVSIFYYIRIN